MRGLCLPRRVYKKQVPAGTWLELVLPGFMIEVALEARTPHR